MAEQQKPVEQVTTFGIDDVEPIEVESLDGSALDPMASNPVSGFRPSYEALSGAAGLYRLAALDMTVTPENVEESLRARTSSSAVQRTIAALHTEDDEVRDLAMRQLIANPTVGVEDKLDLLAVLDSDRAPDINIVQREAASNVATADWATDDEEDDDLWHGVAQDNLESMSKDVEVFDTSNGSVEEQQDTIWKELQAVYAQADENQSFGDYAEAFTPLGALPILNKTVDRIFDDLGLSKNFMGDGGAYLNVGGAFTELRGMIRQASPEQKTQIARVVLNALKEDTGLFQDSNDLVTMQILDNLFSKELSGEDQFTAEQMSGTEQLRTVAGAWAGQGTLKGLGISWADNTFNLMDVMGLGFTAKWGLKFGKKAVPQMWRRLFGIAPKTGAARAAEGVLDPKAAATMGMDSKQILELGLPGGGGRTERGVNVLAELADRQKQQAELAMRQAQPVNMTASERANALQELMDETGALVEQKLPKTHVNMSSVIERADGSGADIEAVFGATNFRGYANVRNARNGAQRLVEQVFGKGAPYEIVKWDLKSGSWMKVPDKAVGGEKGEFFIRATDSRSYDSARKTYGALKIGDDSVADLTLGAGVSTWTRATNIFDKITQGWIATRARAAKGADALGAGFIKPLADLPFRSKERISAIIKKNEGKKVLSHAELKSEGLNEAEIAGYDTFRAMDDTMYDLVDYNLRNQYMREGLKDVHANGVRQGWAKPVERLRASSLQDELVFDPEAGTYTKMSRTDIAALYERGGQLGRLKFPMEVAQGTTKHMLISGKATRVLPVPQRGVLPRIVGHYPHITQGNYVVYGVTKNGQRVAVKMAATASDAAEYVASKKALMISRSAKGKNTKFVHVGWEADKSLQSYESWGQKLDEIFQNNGGVLYGQRSNSKLGNLSKDFGDINVDPIQALLTGWGVATHSVTKGALVASMKQRLYNFLKSPENKNLFIDPTTKPQYLGVKNINQSFTNTRARDTAMAYARQIELMEHTPDAWRNATKEVYRRMAYQAYELAQRPFITRIGLKPAVRKAEQVLAQSARYGDNAVNAMMSYAHAMYIAMMAPKQFVLQASQSLMALGLSPKGFASAMRQFTSVAGGVHLTMKTLHAGKAVVARPQLVALAGELGPRAGMTAKEYIDVIDTLVESGLLDAVMHNSMIKEAVGEAANKSMLRKAASTEQALGSVGRAISQTGQVITAPIRGLSRVGFQAGENINQIMSFLTLYNRDRAKGIADLASHAYRDDLVGRTAELTGGMISETAPAYTRSYLKPFFQWIQFQHKMILMALPKKMGGSNLFTGTEKARIFATQFLLYGTHATALVTVAHSAIEKLVVEKLEGQDPDNAFVQAWRSEPVKAVLDGFLLDYSANKALQALFGDESKDMNEFEWGKAFAPGAGAEFLSDRLMGLFTMDTKEMFGVQGKFISNLAKFGDRVSKVVQAQWKGMDDVPLEQRVDQLLKQGLVDTIPMYGKYVATRWALAHDARVTEGGRMTEGFDTKLEAIMSTLFGVDTKERNSYYETLDRVGISMDKRSGEELQDIANVYWTNLVLNSTKFEREAVDESMYDTMLSNWSNEQGLVLSALSPRDKERLNEIIASKLEAVRMGEGTPQETQFVQRFAKTLAAGDFGERGPQLAAYMANQDFVKNNPERAILIQQAWEEIAEEPTPENISTNEVAK